MQAKRLGAENVTLVYRRGEESMSATTWERDLARTNEVVIKTWAMPVCFEGTMAVTGAVFEKTAKANGKLGGTGETFVIAADMVLKAIGQKLEDASFEGLKLQRGKIAVDASFQTSIAGIFAGGDCIVSGEDLTVQAVEDGKRAAIAADKYVRGA